MNVYDTANRLASEIRNYKEYKEYKKIKEEVKQNLDLKEKIDQFEKIRYEIQLNSIKGEQQDEKKAEEIQKLYVELIQNEKVKQYFDLELKFNVLLADVNKIIAESVKDILN